MIITYTQKDFQTFKDECQRLIDILGLKNWKVYFVWEQLINDRFAEITTDAISMTATITLTKKIKISFDKSYKDDVKQHAKHEVIHLLLGRISHLAKSRFVRDDEIYSAEEEIVQTLSKIIS